MVGDLVYLGGSNQSRPAGPYVVVSVTMDRYYTIKRRDNEEVHPEAVAESRLLVRRN